MAMSEMIIGFGKPKGDDSGDSMDDKPMDVAGAGRRGAAKAIAKALGADPSSVDIGALDKALGAYVTACEGDEGEEPSDDKYSFGKSKPFGVE